MNNAVESYPGVDWNKQPTKKDRFPTGDWNVPTREEEAKFHYWIIGISLFLMLVFAPYASAIEISTFQPGDVSLFTIVEDDSSYYINFTEAFYSGDFSVTSAIVSINSTWDSNPYAWNDSFVGVGTADGYNGWTEFMSGACGGYSWDLSTDGGLQLGGSCTGSGGYSALSNSDALIQDRTYIQFFWDSALRGDCSSGIGDNYLYLYEGTTSSDKIFDLSWRCLQGVGCNYWVLQNVDYGQIEAGSNLVQIYNIDYTAFTFDIRVTNEDSGAISLDETDVPFLNNHDHYDTMTFRTGTSSGADCSMQGFNIQELAVGDFTGLTPSEIGYWNLSLDSSEIKSSFMGTGTSGETNFDDIDFSSHLTTALGDCSGSPCNIPWNLSSNGNWGDLTLYNLFIVATTSPTLPSILAPLNNSAYFHEIDMECSGSTDPDGDNVTYNFYSPLAGTLSNWDLDNYNRGSLNPNPYTGDSYQSSTSCGSAGVGTYGGYYAGQSLRLIKATGSCNQYLKTESPGYSSEGADPAFYEDFDITMRMYWDEWDDAGAGLIFWVNGDDDLDADSDINAPQFTMDGHNLWVIRGTDGTGETSAGYTLTWDEIYTVRFRGEDLGSTGEGNIMLKIWNSTDTEPEDWLVETTIGGCEECANEWFKYKWGHGNSNEDTFYILDVMATNKSLIDSSTTGIFEWDAPVGTNYWFCNACDDSNACSAYTDTLAVTRLNFEQCSIGSATTALNFTAWDEEDDTIALNDTIEMTVTLQGPEDNIAFSTSTTQSHETNFCLTPGGFNVNITGLAQYLPDNSSYTFPRQYYLESLEINGDTSENINLYSLVDSLSTAVTFIASRAGSAVPDILIHLQRFDAGTGLFTLIATGKTSLAGTDVIYLRLTDAFYRIVAYESPYTPEELVYDSGSTHITSSPYTMLLSGGSTGQTNNWYDTWNAFGSIAYTLTFNASGTNAFLLVADDATGATTSMCLKVDKWDAQGGQQNVCYDCATTSSISISCIIPDTNSYYTAKFIANANSDLFQAVYGFAVDLTTGIGALIGNANGAFFTFLLVGVSAFMALYSPMAAVVLAVLAFGFGWAMGLLNTDTSMMMVLVAFASIVIATMYKRRTY